MTLRLILTRHAKSSWGDPTLGDHARPLNDRGRTAASAIGTWMEQNKYRPSLVLSSDSKRTRETWARIVQNLGVKPRVEWLPDLYLARAQTMLDVLKTAGTAKSVLMLGHNPGIANCAEMLVRQPPEHDRFADYPSGATTVIDFDCKDWRNADWGLGTVIDFVVPRDL